MATEIASAMHIATIREECLDLLAHYQPNSRPKSLSDSSVDFCDEFFAQKDFISARNEFRAKNSVYVEEVRRVAKQDRERAIQRNREAFEAFCAGLLSPGFAADIKPSTSGTSTPVPTKRKLPARRKRKSNAENSLPVKKSASPVMYTSPPPHSYFPAHIIPSYPATPDNNGYDQHNANFSTTGPVSYCYYPYAQAMQQTPHSMGLNETFPPTAGYYVYAMAPPAEYHQMYQQPGCALPAPSYSSELNVVLPQNDFRANNGALHPDQFYPSLMENY